MHQPWTVYEWEACVGDAMDIAIEYLGGTGQVDDLENTPSVVGSVVMARVRLGMTNKIRLANEAIVAVERLNKQRFIPFDAKRKV